MNIEHNHIIIGLGGTGGNTIKTFRQQVVDKYGAIDNIDAVKNIEFLYVDSNASEFSDEKWEYHGKNIKLQGNSTLLLRAGILKELLDDYSSRPDFLGNNSEWGDVLADKELAKKAGNQMRRLGAVNLLPNLQEIVNRVAQKERSLSSNKRATTLIHIIAGLAGGTGSGSIVDVTAQILKYFESRSNDVKVNLYLKLPEVQVPLGWGGQFTSSMGTVSFYQVNGYAALKEINGLASGVFEPYDKTTKNQRIKTTNRLQAAYLFTERNNEGIEFSNGISPIASLLYLKTITADSEKEDTSNLSLPQTLDKIDNAENNTINPSAYWGLAGKFRIPGIYKIGIPKVQIRESFAYLLVMNAFNKLLYKNYDEIGGTGYLGNLPNVSEVQREKNQIFSNLRSALLDEWYLTYQFLILDEPMIDKNNKLLTEGRDDYSFQGAFNKEFSKHLQLLSATKQFNGKFIKDNELIKCLQLAVNDYFNKDYKGLGYERYYSNMLNNLNQTAEFLANRIKEKMFGKEGGKQSRYYPLDSYVDLILYIAQDYMDALEKNLKNKQLDYSKLLVKAQEELKAINTEYINACGLLGSSKKREKAIENAKDALNRFWLYTISLKGINYAIQLIHSHLKNKLFDVKKEIEEEVRIIENRRNILNQEFEEEKRRLTGKTEIKGFKSIANDEGLERFQTALMKNKGKFDEVMIRLESLIFEHKEKILQNPEILRNKDLPIMKQAYNEIDNLLTEANFRVLLDEDDKFYNAHVVEVLYHKYNKDVNNPAIKGLFAEMFAFSAPLASIDNPSGKGAFSTHHEKIIILPRLTGLKAKDSELLDFYDNLKKVIRSTLGLTDDSIKEISDDKYKNEISICQFYWPVRPDQIGNIISLKKEYDNLKKINQIKFLMHTENVEHLVELMPPKTPDEYKDNLLPYLFIINSIDKGFETYGSEKYWKISQPINLNSYESQTSVHDEELIEVFLESNDIETFLKLEFKILDKKNMNEEKKISGFIHPFLFTAIRLKALAFIKDKNNSDTILKNFQNFLDEYLVKVKNDTTDDGYRRYRKAYLEIQEIINNN